VLAMVGSRDPGEQGFNRALDARRSIGSLVKPLVYLVALSQPSKWSLASIVDDEPVNMMQPDGTPWTPKNDDRQIHGQVPMLDALVHSWNLATVNLGMQVGVARIKGFLESFGLENVNPSPSLLLGAIDLSPFQVAQLYEFIASDGHALPLVAVRGVVDAKGQTIKRYEVKGGEGEYQAPTRLIKWAMQQVVNGGTASAIGNSALGVLHAAGKTGTSDSQRDSWFAGFTGQHLAIVWMGRDDNKPTRLYGATGSMRVWQELFRKLPTRPLSTDLGDGLEMAWVNPQTGKRTDPSCQGARQFPFVAGYVPESEEGCFWQQFKGMFGGGDAEPAPAVPSNPTD